MNVLVLHFYVIKYTFSEKPRYNWVNIVNVGRYNINDEAKYTSIYRIKYLHGDGSFSIKLLN